MANQMTITFNVENQILRRTDPNKIIEKSKNYLFAEFSFSEDWDNTNKAIIFENNVLRYKIYLDSNNKCQVPNRIIRNDGFTISVVGEDNNDFVKITTSELYIAVGKGIKSEEEMESIYEITSQSLDVNKNGGTCNLEIKDEYKFYYEMQENDFSNMVSEGGGTWSLDISETLLNVITEFKKRIGVDWVALGLTPPVPSATKCVYSPTRKTFVMFGDEEITYYILSAVDGVGDTSTNFYYQNGSWHVTFFTGNLVDNETFNFRMAEKQDVLQAGEGIDISGNVISTTGGGDTLYRHVINETYSWISLTIITKSNIPFTMQTLAKWLYNNGYTSLYNRYTATNNSTSIGTITSGVFSEDGTTIKYITSNGPQVYQGIGFVDVISEVQ